MRLILFVKKMRYLIKVIFFVIVLSLILLNNAKRYIYMYYMLHILYFLYFLLFAYIAFIMKNHYQYRFNKRSQLIH